MGKKTIALLLDSPEKWKHLHHYKLLSLKKAGYKTLVVFFSNNSHLQNHVSKNHQIVCLNLSPKEYKHFNPKVILSLAKLIKKHQISAVLVQRYKLMVYTVLVKLFYRWPLVILYHVQATRTLRNFQRRLVFYLLHSHLDSIVANSEGVKEDLLKSAFGLLPEKIKVIYNGINVGRFRIDLSKKAARNFFGFPEDKFLFGMAARFKKAKDQEGLIRAFAEIKKRGAEALLVLAGSGPKEKVLRNLISELELSDSVFILNWIPPEKMPIFYRAIDVFAHPSWREGQPTAVMEAMASGLPIITTDAEGVPELFDTPRKFGFMVKRGDLLALTEALWKIYQISPEDRVRMGCEARARIEEAFSHEHMGRRFRELFDSLLRRAQQG